MPPNRLRLLVLLSSYVGRENRCLPKWRQYSGYRQAMVHIGNGEQAFVKLGTFPNHLEATWGMSICFKFLEEFQTKPTAAEIPGT